MNDDIEIVSREALLERLEKYANQLGFHDANLKEGRSDEIIQIVSKAYANGQLESLGFDD